ncbi:MAG: prevent-host-death protein [Candidatus Marinimicrobia bacterium]|nr:prevent-host-death protein [Candidatus Neomarinimicrobiota bacterium]
MTRISANDIKTKGIGIIKEALKNEPESIITERGRERFIVLDLKRYNQLREYELEAALQESIHEVENGEYIEETVEEHVKRLKNV